MRHQRPSTRPHARFGRPSRLELRELQEAIRRHEASQRPSVREPILHIKAGGM
jgi:hypothetical protein